MEYLFIHRELPLAPAGAHGGDVPASSALLKSRVFDEVVAGKTRSSHQHLKN